MKLLEGEGLLLLFLFVFLCSGVFRCKKMTQNCVQQHRKQIEKVTQKHISSCKATIVYLKSSFNMFSYDTV